MEPVNIKPAMYSKAQEWVRETMFAAYTGWAKGKTRKQKERPYQHGFAVPTQVADMIRALDTDCAEDVSYILLHGYLPGDKD